VVTPVTNARRSEKASVAASAVGERILHLSESCELA